MCLFEDGSSRLRKRRVLLEGREGESWSGRREGGSDARPAQDKRAQPSGRAKGQARARGQSAAIPARCFLRDARPEAGVRLGV